MSTQPTRRATTDTRRDPSLEQGLRQTADDQPDGEALDDGGPDDLGMSVGDEIRGHRGSGVVPADDVRSDNDDDERHERR